MGPGVRKGTSPVPVVTVSPVSGSAMARKTVRMEQMNFSVVSKAFFKDQTCYFDLPFEGNEIRDGLIHY